MEMHEVSMKQNKQKPNQLHISLDGVKIGECTIFIKKNISPLNWMITANCIVDTIIYQDATSRINNNEYHLLN